MSRYLFQIVVVLSILMWSCNDNEPQYPEHLADCYALHSLSKLKAPAKEGEWLWDYKDETGQTLKHYIASAPLKTDSLRSKLYLIKIGNFSTKEQQAFTIAQQYLSLYFQIETDTLSAIPETVIPKAAQRLHQGFQQFKSIYILDSVLRPLKPKDAIALIAFCKNDLFPADDWNFVFGQANLNKGIGVWSMARLGDLENEEQSYKQTLLRLLKIAAHETGHMFSLPHCVKYECNMNGSNSLQESDAQPEWLCWECLAKVCYNRNVAPQKVLQDLHSFYKNKKIESIETYYANAMQYLKSVKQ